VIDLVGEQSRHDDSLLLSGVHRLTTGCVVIIGGTNAMSTDDDKPDTHPENIPAPDLRLAAQVRGAMERLTGRCYQIDLKRLDTRSLQELVRFLRDVECDRDSAVRRARLQPWRR
jgi:hypothetical protein